MVAGQEVEQARWDLGFCFRRQVVAMVVELARPLVVEVVVVWVPHSAATVAFREAVAHRPVAEKDRGWTYLPPLQSDSRDLGYSQATGCHR